MSKENRFDKLIEQLTVHKTQLMAAGVMLVLAAGPIASAYFYVPKTTGGTDTAALTAAVSESIQPAGTTAPIPETTEKAEEAYIPSPGELNLAYFFPEGADQSKVTESLAGQAFQALMTHDEQWMSKIYDMADASPLQMAEALGKPKAGVLGKYNYKDELHDIKNPDTWTINSFKKVRMTFTDGDGKPVSAYSNVIDIMSMANLYTYFKGVEDYDLFLSYSKELWERSHSYTVGISDIYYCDGCLDEDAERREYEELEAEARAEEAGYLHSGGEETALEEAAAGSAPVPEDSPGETASAVIIAGTAKKAAEETTAAPPETETVPESTSGVIVAGQSAATAFAKEGGTDIVSSIASAVSEAGAATQSEAPQIAAAEATVSGSVPEAETTASEALAAEASSGEDLSGHATPADAEGAGSRTAIKCPGHVDLIVNVKVAGLKEENGLFQKDAIGNNDENLEEGGWPGWNNYTMASARLLSSQDWFEKYGLSLSVISMMNPLTEAEIDAYMNQLPGGISQTRKDLIHFALSSVGKVPYYWGGKPSSPHYSGNSFGIMTAPDYKGRVLKGLDCSGWINWVYWSVTGKRLPYESTSGLAISGTRIKRSDLQPGDIIVRTGSDAHVIMFLGWTADGKIRCIHESSAGVNNVTVAIRDAYWPYYRRLVD